MATWSYSLKNAAPLPHGSSKAVMPGEVLSPFSEQGKRNMKNKCSACREPFTGSNPRWVADLHKGCYFIKT
jgi:tRNA G26 N,N-dimethylase Trm1